MIVLSFNWLKNFKNYSINILLFNIDNLNTIINHSFEWEINLKKTYFFLKNNQSLNIGPFFKIKFRI